jgi:excisionase family DNA binding protein
MMMKEIAERIDKEKIYTTGEVAELLGVSNTTVRFWIKRGWLEGIRVGGRYKVKGDALLEFLEKGQE